MARWRTTEGTILQVDTAKTIMRTQNGHKFVRYYPVIRYEYEVAGEHYEGERYSERHFLISHEKYLVRLLRHYAVGSAAKVFYDPTDPAYAFLRRGYGSGLQAFVPLAVAVALLVLAMICTVITLTVMRF